MAIRDEDRAVRAALIAAAVPAEELANALSTDCVALVCATVSPTATIEMRETAVRSVRDLLIGWIHTPRSLVTSSMTGDAPRPDDVTFVARLHARRREWVHEAIADAIVEERDRCAMIARERGYPGLARAMLGEESER